MATENSQHINMINKNHAHDQLFLLKTILKTSVVEFGKYLIRGSVCGNAQ